MRADWSRLAKTFNTGDTEEHRVQLKIYAFRIFFFASGGRVSQAVRRTSLGAWLLIVIKYEAVRFASNLAVSRRSQPRPFWTMSSLSARSESESFWISGKNIFLRVPRIRATQAARRRQRLRDFDHWKICFVRAGSATTMGAIRSWTKASWSAQLLMRSSQEAKSLKSEGPQFAVKFSRRNTATIFSSSTEPENNSSASFTRKAKSLFCKISRRKLRLARRRSAVYQPWDLISSLKN